MSSLKEIKGEHVHTRSIHINTFAAGEDCVLVEGVLEDTRHTLMHSISGQLRQPSQVHGMVARFLVGELPAKILDAEAEMPNVPLDGCDEAGDSIKKLIGMPIVSGFSKAVKGQLGGTQGCNHLTSLALTMGAAAVQSMAAHRGQKPIPPQARAMMLQYVKNSCRVWDENGEVFRNATEKIKKELE